MVYEIVTYGDEALRKKSVRVDVVDESIRQLADDMLVTMRRSSGVGLAAEQVGRDESLFVVEVPAEAACGVPMPLVLINPEITASEGKQRGEEGCLSFPGLYTKVTRSEHVVTRFTNLDGEEQTLEADGLLARAIQHELDHLNGVLLVDRMSPAQKVANAGRLRRLKAETLADTPGKKRT